MTALGFAIALAADQHLESPRALWVFLVFEATVALNAVAHVVSAVVLFKGYGPGLATAVLINTPLAIYCLLRASRERWVSRAALRATLPAALILHGPILFGGIWLASRTGD